MAEKASRTGAIISELEGQLSHFLVLRLGEFVLQGGEEFGVDLEDEALDIVSDLSELSFCIISGLLHIAIPHVDLLDALGG